ncbi:MAG: translation initiation factor IF-2 [Verrucomicrobia bacterium]|nr:translation initiation factor IF-2 [Verrucomicrobiota bacterium]MBU1734569.1 translation initiation factor IF-2 [Verrucomicrobiota bacterium]MBU1857092.1 translation initiation factor IF-2 [Verrucomicrobiota bacterium]
MRVYDLARELNVSNKELMAKLASAGIAVKSPSSSINDEATQLIRSQFPKATDAAPAATAATAASAASASVPRPPADGPSKPPEQLAVKSAPKVPAKPTAKQPMDKPAAKPAPEFTAKPVSKPSHPAGKPISKHTSKPVEKPAPIPVQVPSKSKVITVRGAIIVRELAEQMGLKPNQLIIELMAMNVLASINERIDLKVAQQIAEKHGALLEHEKKPVDQKPPVNKEEDEPEEADRPEDLEPRPPVVTFLGHIDHGKTSLLDRIRNTAVAKSEAGGITQHVGAYTIEYQNKKITFLDTPGHAAFTAMRARGANLTDIAIIVIAADDGIMPQTEEAIKHAQAAKTTIIVAINKMDLPTANPDQVKRQLQGIGLSPEDWGGTIICAPVSATTGKGMDHLLEMILLQAEMMELKVSPKGRAHGYVIEAQLEPGMGPTANLLVTHGTLHIGDIIMAGPYWGRVKALINDHGIKLRTALPSMPVKCMGLSGVPQAGAAFQVYTSDRVARDLAEHRKDDLQAAHMIVPKKVSLDTMAEQLKQNQRLELKLILKCDTQGSLEAIRKVLGEIKSDKISIAIVMDGVGNINENDVLLASASNAIVIGFNVSKEERVARAQKAEGVEIRLYSIIYQIADEIREAMSGMLAPELRDKLIGRAEVRQVFPISKTGNVAGCLMVHGRVHIRCKTRVKRAGDLLYEGSILTLKRFQDEVNEVREGQECGIRLKNFTDVAAADILEFFEVEKIPQKL